MPSSTSLSSKNRLRLSQEILRSGEPAEFPCDRCCAANLPCVMSSRSAKCAHCTQKGRPCVAVSWESLDRTRNETESKIQSDEKEREILFSRLAELHARIERNRKILKQAEERAASKMECLRDEMEAEGEDFTRVVLGADASEVFDPDGLFDFGGSPAIPVGSPGNST